MDTVTRNIIRIDEDKCNGCGLCATACAEGAIRIVDGKARLVSETYCDGLGACLGECPTGAITIEPRKAAAFDPAAVERHLAGPDAAAQRPAPAKPAGHAGHVGCPGSLARFLAPADGDEIPAAPVPAAMPEPTPSRLRQWPVQLHLVPAHAPFWENADLLIAADCTAFACGGFHEQLLKGRRLVIACPKLDDKDGYLEKLTEIFAENNIRGVTVAVMEVPCCQGLRVLVEKALAASGKVLPYRRLTVKLDGAVEE